MKIFPAWFLLLIPMVVLTQSSGVGGEPDSDPEVKDLKARVADLERKLDRVLDQNDRLQQRLMELTSPAPEATGDPVSRLADEMLRAAEAKGKEKQKAQAAKADESKGKSPVPTDGEWIVGKQLKTESSWKNGLWAETADKAFRLNVGGVIQFDTGFYGADQDIVNSIGVFNNFVDPGLALQDAMSLRRARLRFAGLMYEQVEFFAQYDFAQSIDLRRRTLGVSPVPASPPAVDYDPADSVLFNEVYVGLTKVPYVGNVRIGRQRESLNFVTATSDTNQVWLERGLLFDAFNGDYNFSNGVTVANSWADGRTYALLGFFQQNNPGRTFSSVGDGDYAYDVRLTALPLWNEADQLWVHVGVDYSYRNLYLNQIRYRSRPMIRNGSGFQVPNIVNTGLFYSPDAQQIANLELASAWGRWTATAEATHSWVTNAYTGGVPVAGTLPKGVVPRGTYNASGAYAELLYFLTPDHRPYRKERPGHDRVIPASNLFCLPGARSAGAWEVGVRYDWVDLTDSGINGGSSQAVTFAVNWYLNPNARVQTNYFIMNRGFSPTDTAGRVEGDFQGLGIRVNLDF